ncbi:ADOP family duplicated permease [Occallatibacter riparius]|uniref:ADOP family duplicated permease n=1 Tax=Occallatibacter riparius TaxID=1002689 RepID=A0A9J7BLI5_9BACT|nr:ADOP family duplicated permease [Occallatibacter riparius]UWZ83515.1 ADOP family duplicated permease [Occallatibacter riparius]
MSLWSRISNAFRGDRLNREIDEEMQSHIDEAIASGRDPGEARRAFGSALLVRETSHGIRVAGSLESLLADIRFGWRQLWRNKVTSLAAVLSLALGIGSCVAAFRLIDALLWRPLPISGANRLFALSRKLIGPEGKPIEDRYWSTPDFNVMRTAVKDQADLIAISDADRTDITWSTDDEIEKAHVVYVSGNMFPLFGLEPALGRLLAPADDRGPGLAPYAVLSCDYWNHRFGRDPRVLGRSVHIEDQVFEIIGVGPRDFTGTETGTVTDLFLPLSMNSLSTRNGVSWHHTFLMLKPGVNPTTTLEPLRQHLSAVSHAFETACSTCFRGATQATRDRLLNKTLVLNPAGAGISELQKEYRRYLGVLGLLVVLVLLIACVNVANMMTAQAAARAQEMALRISIGAGRRRLIQLILTQSALLALLASAVGALFAAWSAPFVLGLVNPPDTPARLDLPADGRVLLFGLALILVVVLLLGLLPALRASAVRPVAALKGGEDPHSPRRFMRVAIALQVAFCVLVLFLSSLFVTSFQRLQNRPLGFSTDRLLLLQTVAGKGQLPVVWDQTAEALRAAPGVDSVAIAGWPLLGRIKINTDVSINNGPPSPTPVFFLYISPGWLSTMKIPLIAGRDFRPEDASPGAAIVNETFAKTFFPGEDPVGRTFSRGVHHPINKIVGVTPDVPDHDLREPNRALFYMPFNPVGDNGAPTPAEFGTFVVHTKAGNPLALADSLRQLIAERRNGLRVSNVTTQLDLVRDQTIRERLIATLGGFFAAVALLLAGIGLYAVLNYSVLQRRREIGIRMAIGSSRTSIVRLVTFDSFLMIALGGCAGLVLGFGAARYVTSLFYQVKATDSEMIVLPACAILLTALLATLPAVLRALRTDPTEILRAE